MKILIVFLLIFEISIISPSMAETQNSTEEQKTVSKKKRRKKYKKKRRRKSGYNKLYSKKRNKAQPRRPKVNDNDPSYYDKNTVDLTHESISSSILSFSQTLDTFFSDTKHNQYGLKNKSKLKVTFDTFFREAAGPYVVPDLNYRLLLPNTQRKFQLFIEGEKEDSQTETSVARGDRATQNAEDNNTTAGLRYLVEKSGIKYRTDSGIIVNVPLVAFARFTVSKDIPLDIWLLRAREQIRWVNNTGFTSDLNLDFDRKLSRKYLLRFVNNTFWNDNDYSIKFENGPSIFHQIDNKRAISYHAHVLSVNKPEFVLTDYLLQFSYRQLVYKNWLYLQFSPYIRFPRIKNFYRTPGALLRFEAIFGYI